MSSDARTGGSPLDEALQRMGGPSLASTGLPPWQLDTALRLALRLAELPAEDPSPFREAMYTEVRRRLFPQTFAPPSADAGLVATFFFPLAGAVIEELVRRGGEGTAVRLPFVPLADSDISPWPSGEEYRRLLRAVDHDGVLACLAMAQEWFGLSIFDHVLGVTGLSLHLGRQLARSVSVDLPLLHGAAIGHDIGKFGCAGDEVRRIPRLHYYYTHVWYQARGLPGLGHIATNHSCWDLELIRLPVETQLLIYADFRVKEVAGPDGVRRMTIISLRDAYHAIRDKLENVDDAKLRRYEGVYRKLRDLEDYLLALGVELDPPGFATEAPAQPRLPRGLDVIQVLAGKQRPDVVALATGSEITTVCRYFATAHNIGVMERLRDVPALKALLEEARSFERWRDLRTYIGVLTEYAPAFSQPQKELALDFFYELLGHRDDDIRYHAANRIGDLLALGEEEWRKDLPAGVVTREGAWVEHRLDRLFALLDRAGTLPEQDMGPTERVLYAIPILLRRLVGHAEPGRREPLLDHIFGRLAARRGDHRPLVGLYVCESCEVLLPHLDARRQALVLELAREWSEHEVDNVRLMAWRVLVFLARRDDLFEDVRNALTSLAQHLGQKLDSEALVAELFLLGELAARCGLDQESGRFRDLRERDRQPLRDVMLRNLKTRVGWVEKKINCDYLVSVTMARVHDGDDPGSLFANEVASHLANLLKVSRVEGTRFHAGRCLLEVLPTLAVTQHNDLMVELLRSLELDVEAVTRYIPRFLGTVLATLPVQEFDEGLDDIQLHVRRGSAPLQRLLLQTVGWVIVSLPPSRLQGVTLRRLAGIVLGALGETRASTVHEALAQIAMVIERLLREASGGVRVASWLTVLTKKLLSLVTHQPADRSRFFLIASALSHLEMGLRVAGRRVRLPARPTVAFMPGTFDPFTTAHAAVVTGVLEHVDELLIQVDDYSWNKHAQPRETRKELAWMALAPVLGAFLSPLEPPINLANPESVKALRRRLHGRVPTLVVGSDVVAGASAYRDPGSHVWALPHVVAVRKGTSEQAWQEKLQRLRAGARVLRLPPETRSVSSTTLRSALDRGADLEGLCDPLIARTLTERQLYVNYPSRKEQVRAPRYTLRIVRGTARLPGDLPAVVRLDEFPALTRWAGRPREMYEVAPRDGEAPDAALSWRELAAAALPFLITEVRLKALADGRLSGLGALVDGVAAAASDAGRAAMPTLLSRSMARWLDAGLQFALIGVPEPDRSGLTEVLREWGAAWLPEGSPTPEARRWAWVSLSDPLILLWDFESVLQPHYAARPEVGEVIASGRRELALFFARRNPGSALFHLPEREAKRVIVEWARARLAEEKRPRQWVILGLGRQFLRDVCGDVPTIALDLERFLTVQGYDAGVRPSHGSPTLEMQLHTARELGHDAMLLTPFLESAEKVLMVRRAARAAGVTLREVLIGVTSADVHATLHLEGIVHRCGAVVPRWQGVIRESALAPYVGGWSILGREALEAGSLLPSLNDCLPYHHPHPLGLDGEAALDFSRLALNHTRRLFLTLEEMFRATEGRLLGVRDLPFVVRTPRCPPFPQGFEPPSERLPSELLAEDIEALARLHPETHAAHRHGWSGE